MQFEVPPGATPLDPDEAMDLIPVISTQAELNEYEALNILDALMWVDSNPKVRERIHTSTGLIQLHQRMFKQVWKWAGTLRKTEKNIGVQPWRIRSELENLVQDALVWRQHETYSSDEISARFHHRLVWIHPFPNGNGRHARLAADLLLEHLGMPAFTWGTTSLSSARSAGEVRSRYMAALREADRGNIGDLLEFARS